MQVKQITWRQSKTYELKITSLTTKKALDAAKVEAAAIKK